MRDKEYKECSNCEYSEPLKDGGNFANLTLICSLYVSFVPHSHVCPDWRPDYEGICYLCGRNIGVTNTKGLCRACSRSNR